MTPTKVILIVLLLASAITGAFANPPGGSYIQCDPKIRARRFGARRTAGDKAKARRRI